MLHKPSMRMPLLKAFTTLLFLFVFNYSFTQNKASALQLVQGYLADNHQRLGVTTDEVANILITHEYTDEGTGIRHIYATQTLNGLTINGSSFSLHTIDAKQVDANRLVAYKSMSVSPVNVAVISKDAVLKVMQSISYPLQPIMEVKQSAQGTEQNTIYKRNNEKLFDIPCRLVYYNDQRAKSLIPAWEVEMMDANRQHFWLAYVDAANGKVLEKRDLIKHCSFNSFATDEKPATAQQQQADFAPKQTDPQARGAALPNNSYRVYDMPYESPIDPGSTHSLSTKSGDTLASPDGWHRVNNSTTYNYTHGNNVWAFQDPSPGPLGGVPSADPTRTSYPTNTVAGVPPVTEPFVFDYPINLANEPETYMKAAIVNLFYWNNLMHDVFYYLGFTEAAGNFEEGHVFSTRTATSGQPNDEVLAQAQDGGGTNNANFLTTTDGTPGQMQMYLWTTASADSLVQITSSTSGTPPAGKKFIAIQGSLNSTSNINLYTNPVLNKQLVVVHKNALSTVGTDEEGCSSGQQSVALPPSNNVSGKIAVVRRGDCSFVEKVLGAQEGGAVGVIIVNNIAGAPLPFGGSDAVGNAVTIPAVMVSKADGDLLIAQLNAGATIIGSLKRNNPPAPKRDGDIDNGVICHEYGHGISNRLTGGPNSTLPLGGDEEGGEGWSDYIAMYMTLRTNDLGAATSAHPNGVLPSRSIGNYVTYQAYNGQGIREYPYSTDMTVNPATFAYVKRPDYSETHSVGFVWCSMLYELLQTFVDLYGMNNNVYQGANPTASHNPPSTAKGNNIAMRLVIEGMKLQPVNPTFIDERDAILKADTLLYNAQHSCRIWKAFAKRGLGYSAVSGSNTLGDEVEAYDLPYSCDTTQRRFRISKSGPVKTLNNAAVSYTIKVTNLYARPANTVVITDTLPAGLTFSSASNSPTVTGSLVKWTMSFAASETKTLTLVANLSLASASAQQFGDDQEGPATSFIAANQGGLDTWTHQTNAAQAFSGSKYWFVPDTDLGGSNTTLQTSSPINIPANANLVFIHKYATENGYDGGVVEYSENNTTWTYLPPNKFIQNGYNTVIPTANNPSIGTTDLAAFGGASGGYIVSIADLGDLAGHSVYFRFRFTSDATGGSITDGGWWLDDVYVLANLKQIANKATAISSGTAPFTPDEGANAYDVTNAFVLGGVLASELGPLTAIADRETVKLAWTSYTEQGVASYVVERKASADAEFRTIGEVNAAGNSNSTMRYAFNDAHISNGIRYQYRVKQVSRDGHFSYTNIASVQVGGKTFNATIYPNPTEGVANLSITNPSGSPVSISLFDALGKKLATLKTGETTAQRVAMPVQYLKAGTYWVQVDSGEEHTTLKLVKK